MRKIIFGVICVLSALSINAAQIDLQQALRRASQSKTAVKVMTDAPTVQPDYVAVDNDGNYLYYVVNNPDEGGWVIVSADDNFPALLAYGTEGSFHYDSIPDNMRRTLDIYERNITESIHNNITINQPRVPASRQTAIPNFVPALWDQSYPFNIVVREQTGSNCYTGCVATAMAMAMQYYRYPSQGIGQHTYNWKNDIELSADFSASTYNWDMMPDIVYGKTEAEQRAVAQLMYDCGVSVDMIYGTGASAANAYLVPGALYNYFGYDDGMRLNMQRTFSIENWKQMIYDELADGRPVLYQGSDANAGGHFFICSGCDGNDMYYINWGWSGSSNGYFNITALNPLSYSFVNDALCVTGMKPADDIEDDGFNVVGMGTLKLYYKNDGQTVQRRDNSTEYLWPESSGFFQGFYNMHWQARPIKFGVIFENVDDPNDIIEQEAYLYQDYTNNAPTLGVGGRITNYQIHHNNFPQSGVYRMYPAATDAAGVWHKVPFDSNSPQYVQVTCSPTHLTYNYPSEGLAVLEADVTLPQGKLTTNGVSLTTEVTNVGEGDYLGPISIRYRHEKDGFWWVKSQQVVIPVGQSVSVQFDLSTSTAGLYQAMIQDAAAKTLCGDITFVVKNPSQPAKLQVTGASTITVDTSQGAQPAPALDSQRREAEQQAVVTAQVPITCTQGYFNGKIDAYIGNSETYETVGHLYGTDNIAMYSGDNAVASLSGTMPAKNGNYYLSLVYTGDNGAETDVDVPEEYFYGTDFTVTIMTEVEIHQLSDEITAIYTLNGIRLYDGTGSLPTLKPGSYIVKNGVNRGRVLIIR